MRDQANIKTNASNQITTNENPNTLGIAFEITTKSKENGLSRITNGHLRPFRWLEFKVIRKETSHFHRIMSKKTQISQSSCHKF